MDKYMDMTIESGETKTETEKGATSTDLAFLDAIVRGVDRINNRILFNEFGGSTRSSTPAAVGIATVYSASDNIAQSIDLTDSTEDDSNFASTNCAQTSRIGESSNTNLTSTGSLNASVSSSRAASQSFLKTLRNLEPNVRVEAAISGSSRNISVSKKSQVSFTDEETKWLLDQYYIYMDQIGPMKLFRTKNAMWQTLASKMNVVFDTSRTADDLSKRVTNVVELKKSAVNRNSFSGGVRTRIEYQEELEKIASLDDSIEPEVMRGIKYVKYKEKITRTIITKKKNNQVRNLDGILSPIKREY